MKKLLFTAYNLDLGGIEKALVNLLSNLSEQYDITLILEKKEGIFLDLLPKNIKVLEYSICEDKNILLRKIKNRLKLIMWKIKLFHKYDFSCSFATYSIPGSHLARAASSNNTLWMHANYYIDYGRDEEKLSWFLNQIFIKEFKRIVFVSEENKIDINNHFKGIENKSIVCNNIIDGDEIINKSLEKCDYKRKNIPLLVNVGRHEEHQKKITRIIEASKKLINEGYQFQIIFVGDGPDHEYYKKMIKEYKLDKYLIFLGRKKNPYPYYKIADAVILSSEYEGYPVVFLESLVLNKPILSTKVSDYKDIIDYGIFDECTVQGVYKMMKKYFDEGFVLKAKFDYKQFNQNIIDKVNKMIDNK